MTGAWVRPRWPNLTFCSVFSFCSGHSFLSRISFVVSLRLKFIFTGGYHARGSFHAVHEAPRVSAPELSLGLIAALAAIRISVILEREVVQSQTSAHCLIYSIVLSVFVLQHFGNEPQLKMFRMCYYSQWVICHPAPYCIEGLRLIPWWWWLWNRKQKKITWSVIVRNRLRYSLTRVFFLLSKFLIWHSQEVIPLPRSLSVVAKKKRLLREIFFSIVLHASMTKVELEWSRIIFSYWPLRGSIGCQHANN